LTLGFELGLLVGMKLGALLGTKLGLLLSSEVIVSSPYVYLIPPRKFDVEPKLIEPGIISSVNSLTISDKPTVASLFDTSTPGRLK